MMTDRNLIVEHLRKNYTYDAATGAVVNRRGRVVKGFRDSKGYLELSVWVGGQRNGVALHRVVWALNHGRWPREIDHINGNRADNRIENLREVSRSENSENRLCAWRPNQWTGLPGVCYQGQENLYKTYAGRTLYFRDKYEAFVTATLLGRMFRSDER